MAPACAGLAGLAHDGILTARSREVAYELGMPIDVPHLLASAGIVLLALAALLGFQQARAAPGSDAHGRWRVAHNGGTAGGVQLIALATAWPWLDGARFSPVLALGLALSTWAFFVGPTLRALGSERMARRINLVGAAIAVPSYLALPCALLF